MHPLTLHPESCMIIIQYSSIITLVATIPYQKPETHPKGVQFTYTYKFMMITLKAGSP